MDKSEIEPFVPTGGPNVPLAEFLGQCVGRASTCWEPMTGTGVFDEKSARGIVMALERRIDEERQAAYDDGFEAGHADGQESAR